MGSERGGAQGLQVTLTHIRLTQACALVCPCIAMPLIDGQEGVDQALSMLLL